MTNAQKLAEFLMDGDPRIGDIQAAVELRKLDADNQHLRSALDRSMALSYVKTRHHSNDPETSVVAAQAAVSQKACGTRLTILATIEFYGPLTGREISQIANIDYHEVQRRISEIAGIFRNGDVRSGCKVWAMR